MALTGAFQAAKACGLTPHAARSKLEEPMPPIRAASKSDRKPSQAGHTSTGASA